MKRSNAFGSTSRGFTVARGVSFVCGVLGASGSGRCGSDSVTTTRGRTLTPPGLRSCSPAAGTAASATGSRTALPLRPGLISVGSGGPWEAGKAPGCRARPPGRVPSRPDRVPSPPHSALRLLHRVPSRSDREQRRPAPSAGPRSRWRVGWSWVRPRCAAARPPCAWRQASRPAPEFGSRGRARCPSPRKARPPAPPGVSALRRAPTRPSGRAPRPR